MTPSNAASSAPDPKAQRKRPPHPRLLALALWLDDHGRRNLSDRLFALRNRRLTAEQKRRRRRDP